MVWRDGSKISGKMNLVKITLLVTLLVMKFEKNRMDNLDRNMAGISIIFCPQV